MKMKRTVVLACASAVALLLSGHAISAGCDGLAAKVKAKEKQTKDSNETHFFAKLAVFLDLADPIPENVDCSSVVVAVQSLVNESRTGGRRLEPNAGLDRAAAQIEVDSALQKPQVQQAIEAIHHKYSDEEVRLLMEAAVFDEDGSYAARDLRLAQLREKIGA
jgi:hypothetical protein